MPEIMLKPPITVTPEISAGDAAKLMLERKNPVIGKGKLVGLDK